MYLNSRRDVRIKLGFKICIFLLKRDTSSENKGTAIPSEKGQSIVLILLPEYRTKRIILLPSSGI